VKGVTQFMELYLSWEISHQGARVKLNLLETAKRALLRPIKEHLFPSASLAPRMSIGNNIQIRGQ
jgi:hypothetical protein